MRAINHALTGAVIALVIHEPVVALPLAVGSHFVCDAIPHYDNKVWLNHKGFRFKVFLVLDALLCGLLVLWLYLYAGTNWPLMAACAFAAAAPDFGHLPYWLKELRGKRYKRNIVDRFHSWIQWAAQPQGAALELAWFAALLAILNNRI
jgi:hypothetical protein